MQTIFAPINAILNSSVITIRISGDDALKVYEIFKIKQKVRARYATLCDLKYANKLIDKAIIVYYKGPFSFTGEDIIEISLHGSIAIYKRVIDILSNIPGFRLAEAGEFSKRAFLNNKLDLMQAESINDLIKAQTVKQSDRALDQLQGKYSNYFLELRQQFIDIRAYIEAFIDFPDEDIPQDKILEINENILTIKNKISALSKNYKVEKAILNGINISIIGPVNAGKSSLINYLSGKDVSIVSDIAGTTRDIIEVNLDLAGYAVTLIDTAGIRGNSSDEIEKIGIAKTKEKAANSDFKILLLSVEQISEYSNYLRYIDNNTIIVINKSDKVGFVANKFDIASDFLEISIKKQHNLDLLLNKITQLIEKNYNVDDNIAINKERHYNIIKQLSLELEKIDIDSDLLILAEQLRRCSMLLGKIVGLIDVEDILDKIFSSFCIGK